MTVKRIKRGENQQQRGQPKRKFLHIAPLAYRPSINPEKSVYYWWYEYLKRNDQYRRCCKSGGKGRLANLYKDFGDVLATSFSHWWQEGRRGERLFAEPLAPLHLKELRSVEEWEEDWTRESVMVIVAPLSEPKRRLKRWFEELLKRRHTGKRGYATKQDSEALYHVDTKFNVKALEQMLRVYDLKQAEPDLKLAELGRRLGLVPVAMPEPKDTLARSAKKRNTRAATVSRYLKKANAYIENTAAGKFPCAD